MTGAAADSSKNVEVPAMNAEQTPNTCSSAESVKAPMNGAEQTKPDSSAEEKKPDTAEQTKPDAAKETKPEDSSAEETKPDAANKADAAAQEVNRKPDAAPETTTNKRTREDAFPGPHDQRQAKKQKMRPLDLEKDQLILCTCQSRLVLMDATKDLRFMLRRGFPVEFTEEEKKQIETEISEKKDTRSLEDRKIAAESQQWDIFHDRNVPMGCALIRCEERQKRPPSEIVKILLDRVAEKKERSKGIGRLIPMDFACKPSLEAFKELAEKHIKPLFAAGDKTKTWALSFKTRGIKTLSKDTVLKVIDVWSDGHKVSLEDPDVCISVEVNPMFCGVALLDSWKKYDKYNLQSVQNPEAAEKERKRQQDQQKAKVAQTESTKPAEKKDE